MTIFMDGHKTPVPDTPLPEKAQLVGFVPANEIEAAAKKLHLQKVFQVRPPAGDSSRFESHAGFDCVSLLIPDKQNLDIPPVHLDIYWDNHQLAFVYEPLLIVDKLAGLLENPQDETPVQPQKVLYYFFNLLTENDTAFLQDIEEEISDLEDALARDEKLDYIDKISLLRKRLLRWKRYYESLFDLLVDLEENQNGFFTKQQLHYFHLVTNRADRLTRSVMNLRDYVTQVRESYQAQIDISQNQIMKLFTVITAVFLPLSLIAAWYGMNLQMPEYNAPWAYPVVIIASLAVGLGCLAYFKIKKWF